MPTINAFPIQTKRVIDLDVMAGAAVSRTDTGKGFSVSHTITSETP